MTLGEPHPPEKVRRGAWLIGLLAAAALVIYFTDEVQRELAEGPTLWITAEQTRSLTRGAPVWLAGHRVGRVADVTLRPTGESTDRPVLVRAVIRREAVDRFRADASATLRPPGLMEPTVVSVRPGSPGSPPYDFADTLEAGPSVSSAQLRAETGRARATLDTLRRAERRVLALADTGSGTLARLRADEQLRRRLLRQREVLSRAAALLRSDSSTLGLLARRPGALLEGGRSSLGAAGALGARLEEAATRWGSLGATLASLGERADTLEAMIEEPRGSAGRLLRDEALGHELEELRSRILAARAELLANPQRWLRFRLF